MAAFARGSLWQAAESASPAERCHSRRLERRTHHAIDAARQAIDAMYSGRGHDYPLPDCPLERAHRDLHAMLQHVVAQSFWLEDAGRRIAHAGLKTACGLNVSHFVRAGNPENCIDATHCSPLASIKHW